MFFAKRGGIKKVKKKHSLQSQEPGVWQKACFGALRRGVLTVELAFILPLFLLGTGTLICFMDVLRLQTETVSRLCEKAMETGVYAYAAGEKLPVIDIPKVCTYRLPVSIVPLPALVFTSRGRVHSWIGADAGMSPGPAEEMVYVTESGSVYHTDPQCSYVDLSVTQAMGTGVGSLRNQQGARYTSCVSCVKGNGPAKIVYVTRQGEKYHNRISCSRLKRTVRLIPISGAEGRPICSRCERKKG